MLTPVDLTLAAHKRFTDVEAARQHMEGICWPNGPLCPHCAEAERVYPMQGKSHRLGLYGCNGCRGTFTVTVGTVFHRSKVPLHKWLHATHLLGHPRIFCSIERMMREVGVSYKTAWRMASIIRPTVPGRAKLSRTGNGKTEVLCYPFLPANSDRPDHALLRRVNDLVDHKIPQDRRADICQDLIVGLLSGEFGMDELESRVKEATSAVFRLHPDKWAPLSLDAPAPGCTFGKLSDVIAEEQSLWNSI